MPRADSCSKWSGLKAGIALAVGLVIATVAQTAPSLAQSGVSADQCDAPFSRSELWLFSFNHFHCTDQGWSISRRVGDNEIQCAALHPDGQLVIVVSSNGAESALFRNLEHDEWVLTSDQFAEARIEVDGRSLFEQLTQVEVATNPPLRYGLLWQMEDRDATALQRGNTTRIVLDSLYVGRRIVAWDIGLGGSYVAIEAARTCAAWRGGS